MHVLSVLLISLGFNPVSAMAERPDVISNANLELEDKVPLKTVRAIFTMRLRSWPDGTPVRVYVLPDQHPTHQAFCREVLRTFPYQIRQVWDRFVFTGTGQAPIVVDTETELRQRVAETPGAVGYIAANTADDPTANIEGNDADSSNESGDAPQIKILGIR